MNVLILIKNAPLDQSIVNFTSSLFKGEGAQFHLLNIVVTNGEIPTQMNGQVLDFCTEFDLSGYIKKTEENEQYLHTIQDESIVKRSSFAGKKSAIIRDYIKRNKIDLIVGGAHKTTAMEDVFVHTFASNVIENTSIPYLTIKCNRDDFSPQKIALIGDFKTAEIEDIDSLKHLAALHKSEIVLTKIQTPSDKRSLADIRKVMEAYAAVNNLEANIQIIASTDKEAGIEMLHKEFHSDLIVISRSHKKSFFKLLGHSELTNIINHIYAPILIY
jgi:nucleotide-binding universal stress UspA family protein